MEVAIPLRSQPPARQLTVFVVQIATAIVFVATTNLVALLAVAATAVLMGIMLLVEDHRVLAVTAGSLVILTSSARHKPIARTGVLPLNTPLPAPGGLGVSVVLDGRRWWIDRWDFPRLREARARQQVLTAEGL